jgi:hypothetical protein
LILLLFCLNPIILVCVFVAPNYAFCPWTCQQWLISPPNRETLQIILMQKKYMLPKHKMARRKKIIIGFFPKICTYQMHFLVNTSSMQFQCVTTFNHTTLFIISQSLHHVFCVFHTYLMKKCWLMGLIPMIMFFFDFIKMKLKWIYQIP